MKLVHLLNDLFKEDGFRLIDANKREYLIGKPQKKNPIHVCGYDDWNISNNGCWYSFNALRVCWVFVQRRNNRKCLRSVSRWLLVLDVGYIGVVYVFLQLEANLYDILR